MERIKLWRDSFQNWKNKDIPKAQLILTDLPYQLGANAFASSPVWYNDGDNSKGESEHAGKSFFNTDDKAGFRIPEFFHFCANLLKKEPKKADKNGRYDAPCMILFCAFEQTGELIEYAKKAGFNHYINLVFYKNYSAQVLKANMRIVGNCEYGLLFYRDHLPKFRNDGRMIFNCMPWMEDCNTPKVHPTQKPVPLLEYLIRIFTDLDDVVIDCCAGSGTTLLAAQNTGRRAYGFELMKEYVDAFYEKILPCSRPDMFTRMEQKEKAKQLELTKMLYANT